MYVQASKHGWQEYGPQKPFFRPEKCIPPKSLADDRPLVTVDTNPKSDTVSKPMDNECGTSQKQEGVGSSINQKGQPNSHYLATIQLG